MSELPQGVVWVSRPLDVPGVLLLWLQGEPVPAPHRQAWHAPAGPHKARLFDEEMSLHLFGVCPAPGQALKLDATNWVRWCLDCHVWGAAWRDGAGREIAGGKSCCPKCHKPLPEKHALVLEVKKLEA